MKKGSDQFNTKLSISIATWFDELVRARIPGQVSPQVMLDACALILVTNLSTIPAEDRCLYLENTVTNVVVQLAEESPDTEFEAYTN